MTRRNRSALAVRSLPGVGYDDERDLLAAPAWTSMLDQFARSTGITVALTDCEGHLRAGPFSNTPLGTTLIAAGAWNPGGECARSAGAAAADAIATNGFVFAKAFEALTLCAAPLSVEGTPRGTVVAGWTFETFLDPVAADRLAKQLATTFPALWHVLRQQSPVSRDKLRGHGELLPTVSASFLGEIASSVREKRRANELELLNAAARGLASATSDGGIGDIAVDTAARLVGANHIRLLLVDGEGTARIVAEHDGTDVPGSHGDRSAVREMPVAMNVLRVPLAIADRSPLGWLEVGAIRPASNGAVPTALSALAAQVAVALANHRASAELETQRADLERANHFKDEFLATVSHELRTPLNAILGWTQIVRRGQVTGEKLERALATIERNARAQERLVGDLLDVSRIITGKLRLEVQPIDLTSVIQGAIESLRPAMDARHQHLASHLEDIERTVSGDPARLQQIVWNLLSNAAKFTPEGGTIEIDASRADNALEIVVSDSGAGIATDFLPYVFEPFRQADGSTTRAHGGLGLGLAIVKRLVELHGGTIRVESPGRRGGATFIVKLPVVEDAAADRAERVGAARAESDRRAREAMPLRGLRVVVIDDDADSRSMAALVIEGAGATVESCESAERALAAIASRPPDVIVSDIAMPGIDGYTLLRRLRKLTPESGSRIPAVALTARAHAEDRVRAMRAGFQVHVAKPVEPTELVAAIAASVGRFEIDGQP